MRWFVFAIGIVLVFASMSLMVLRWRFNGSALAQIVERILNSNIRGRVEIESIEWPFGSLSEIVAGGWVPITMNGLKVYDDGGVYEERGKHELDESQRQLVLDVPVASAYIDLHSLMFGHPDIIIRDLDAPGGYVLVKEVQEPYPLHPYDYNVVSIASAFYAYLKPGFRSGLAAQAGPVFDIQNFSARGVEVEILFPAMHMRVSDASADGYVHADFSDPLKARVYLSLDGKAKSACILRLGELPGATSCDERGKESLLFDPILLEDLEIKRLAQLPTGWPKDTVAHDIVWDISARIPDESRPGRMHLFGALRNYWVPYEGGDYDVTLSLENTGPLVEALTKGLAGGDELSIKATVAGQALTPRFQLHLANLDVSVPLSQAGPPLDLHIPRAIAAFDMATEAGFVKDTIARGAGGEVRLSAAFDIAPFQFELRVDILQSLLLRDYLPADVDRLIGSKLRGKLQISGDGEVQYLDQLDLWLGDAHIAGRVVRDASGVISIQSQRGGSGLTIQSGETDIAITRGEINVPADTLSVDAVLSSNDLHRWLRKLKMPLMASSLKARARLSGPIAEPRVDVELAFGGIPIVDKLASKLAYFQDTLVVDEAQSRGLDGTMTVRGKLKLSPNLALQDAQAQLTGINLAKLPLIGPWLSGTVEVQAKANGPLARITSEVRAGVSGFLIAGDRYAQTPTGFCSPEQASQTDPGSGRLPLIFTSDRQGNQRMRLCLKQEDGKGALQATGVVDRKGNLSGELALTELPVHELKIFSGTDALPVGGILSAAQLRLGGTMDAPTVSGTVRMVDAFYKDTFLGAASLKLREIGPGRIGIEGELMQGDVHVDAELSTAAPYEVTVTIDLRRVELDRLVPDLAAIYRFRGWVTGQLKVTTTLVPVPGYEPKGSLRLSETEVWLDHVDVHGRPTPLRLGLSPSTPFHLEFRGQAARLVEPVTLVGPRGAAFTIAGQGSPEALAVSLKGNIAMELFQPYLSEYFSEIRGKLDVDAQVTGSLAEPAASLVVIVAEEIRVRPVGQDAVVSIAQRGRIDITNDQIAPTGLKIEVQDPYTEELATLEVKGAVAMKNFQPDRLNLIISGELAGKMLLVAAPRLFSRASGVAQIELSVRGEPSSPKPDGVVIFASERPFTFTPRGLRREIRFEGGEISFTDNDIEFVELEGYVDDEGHIIDLSGELSMVNWQPVDIDITLSADTLPYRVPKTLDMNFNIAELHIIGGIDSKVDIAGVIEVVDGRYTRNINLISELLTPAESAVEAGGSLFENVPLLANADLKLRVDARAFYVQNNIANIELTGQVTVSGTPSEPRFDGRIGVLHGEFKMPGLRAKFTRTDGTVDFSRFGDFPRTTPTLNIRSESDYRDPNGQEHLVTLLITGPLSAMNWDLYTSSGLNKGQTLTMLLSGRTPEEFRRALGDEAVGRDPGRIAPSADSAESFTDQLLKDLAGDVISLLLEDRLRNLTNLDVARLEIGTGSVGFHGEKELLKNLRFLGDIEQTLRGRTIDLRGELRVTDRFSIEGEYVNNNSDDESDDNDNDGRIRGVLRFLVP